MKQVRTTLGLLLLAFTAPAMAQPEPGQFEVAEQADQVDDESQATDVAFKDDRHLRMTVPVRLSGTGPYRFLIDTGADRTAISFALARKLRLVAGAQTNLHSVTGVSEVGTARVPMLDLRAKQMNDIEAALLEASNMGADGILGLDALRSQRILFDFKAHTLTVVPSAERVLEEEGTIVVTARRRNGRLILTHARAENMRVAVVVDTGSEVTIGNQALRRKLAKARGLRRSGPIELLSVTGEKLQGEYMFVKRLEFGGVVLVNLAVVFADSHAFRQLDLENKPALLLGMNALRSFEKISIDFARKKLRIVLPEKSSLDQAMMASR